MPQTDIVTLSQQARAYLLCCNPAITDALIDYNLLQWQTKQKRRQTPALLYEALLRQVTRSDRKGRALGKWHHPQNIQKPDHPTMAPYLHELLSTALFHFDPRQVQAAYGHDAKKLLEALGGQSQLESISLQLGAKGKKLDKRWKKLTQIACDAARFFADTKRYDSFMIKLTATREGCPETLMAPVDMLCKAVPGLGMAQVCHYLKELGYANYVKPDLPLMDICLRTGLIPLSEVRQKTKQLHTLPKAPKSKRHAAIYSDIISPKRFLMAVVSLCRSKGIVPYEFDKLFWLVDSGKFINVKGQLTEYPSARKEFLALRRKYLAAQITLGQHKYLV